ncbi:acetyl-CoA hydrolase/transferase C-terminal domain-containing protein [Clostridium sediminicola]|uniref:acetyl-CoA hydrolase/transferase family protein n=1 Tax=Clostridium sediminicola TaxID=3114879 RepID=UPI0031F1DA74
MEWKDVYSSKVVSAKEAVSHIQSGDRIVFSHGATNPRVTVDAMVENYQQYKDVEIVQSVNLTSSEYAKPKYKGHFHLNSLFAFPASRDAINEGRADYTPSFFFQFPRLFDKGGALTPDVAMLQVSPPDEHGFCSFGVSCDFGRVITENARIIIAEVNDQMPRVMGDNFIHVSDIDYMVDGSYPIDETGLSKIGDIEKAIGKNCASLIEDGSTLQLGIGSIPDAVLLFLKDKKDLGIHSEMISDGVLELYNAGVITGKEKTIHKGKMVVTFLMGTKKLYDFVDNNPAIELYPVDYINNPWVISQNTKMISINSCIQVDLMGQVNSESMGLTQYSGVGGQVDFVRGASMSKDGKSIIAIPSTAAKGKISRITPFFAPGTVVTTSRSDVHYVVTEYGIADLRGKSLRERAAALINIAHPKFRNQLREEFDVRFNK